MKKMQMTIRQYSKRALKELAYPFQTQPRAASVPSLPFHLIVLDLRHHTRRGLLQVNGTVWETQWNINGKMSQKYSERVRKWMKVKGTQRSVEYKITW